MGIFTFCIFPLLHDLVVWAFLAAMMGHFIAIACAQPSDTNTGKVIKVCCTVGLGAVCLGVIYPPNSTWLGQHAFWLGECIGLVCATAIAPILSSSSKTGFQSVSLA